MARANGRPRSLAVCWLPQDRQPEIPLFIDLAHAWTVQIKGPNAQVQGRPQGVAEAIRRMSVPCNAQLGRARGILGVGAALDC